jgi:hypothetical protein
MKVINEDGTSITIKMTVKQLCYIPITLSLKWLFLFEETVKQMRWHKEGNVTAKMAILCERWSKLPGVVPPTCKFLLRPFFLV